MPPAFPRTLKPCKRKKTQHTYPASAPSADFLRHPALSMQADKPCQPHRDGGVRPSPTETLFSHVHQDTARGMLL